MTDYATPTAGAEVLMIGLRDGLRTRGHAAHLLASRAELLAGEFAADDACFGTTSRFQPLVEAFNPSAALAVRRAVRDFRPDVYDAALRPLGLCPPAVKKLEFLARPRRYDVSRAVRELGLPAGIPVQEGVRRTLDWYRANGDV